MIDTAMRTHLLGSAPLAALVAARIYPEGTLPQKPDLPALTFQQIAERNLYSLTGHSGLIGPLIQIDSWAPTLLAAGELADAVKAAMHKFTGLGLGKRVQGVFCRRRQSFYEPDTKLHRVSADFFLQYGEAA